jgi:hypothetical protein
LTDDKETLLLPRVLRVNGDRAEWVGKDGDGFVEADAMLAKVNGSFARVVFKL